MISGIHHITALASDPQRNLDFYSGILGLRLVKKTVNFDAPEIYHLYYGNETADPGTLLTFFPYQTIPKGRKGKGQLSEISFAIAESSLSYWMSRFDRYRIPYQMPEKRLGETVVAFEDHDGLRLELVATNRDSRMGFTSGHIPIEHAIKGFRGITLLEENSEKTANLLTLLMNYKLIAIERNRFRYSTGDKAENYVDILCCPEAMRGVPGYGTVHHVAFATQSDKTQKEMRERLINFGLTVTPILDRQYFRSIYYREPGGVLFEIATISPGFTIDEQNQDLGSSLKLPSWQEKNRALIEKVLPQIHLDITRFKE